jgi:hypothetical protein
LWVLSVVKWRSLRRANHMSRSPTGCGLSKCDLDTSTRGGLGPQRLSIHKCIHIQTHTHTHIYIYIILYIYIQYIYIYIYIYTWTKWSTGGGI